MRYIISAVAAAALCAMSAAVSAQEPAHTAGGPVQAGNMCWISTSNDNGFGYWVKCPGAPMHMKKKK